MTVRRLSRVLTVFALFSGCNACSGPNRDAGEPHDGGADADDSEDIGPVGDSDLDHEVDLDTDLDVSDAETHTSDADTDRPDGDIDNDALDNLYRPLIPVPVDRPPRECGERCRQVSFAGGVTEFDIWENRIVYTSNPDVFLLDLTSGSEYRWPKEDGENCIHAAIYEETLAVFCYTSISDEETNETFWTFNLSNSMRHRIYPEGADRFHGADYIDIYGNIVVWSDGRNGSSHPEIFIHDLTTGREHQITDGGCCVGESRIWDNRIVFQNFASTRRNIFMYDVGTGTTTRIATSVYAQYLPAIQGDRVVWIDARHDPCGYFACNPDVYYADLSTGEVHAATTEGSLQRSPDIYGNIVVWDDLRNDPRPNDFRPGDQEMDIYLYNIRTSEERQVTNFPGMEGKPRVWGDKVYFVMSDDVVTWSIYEMEIDL